MVSWPRLLGRGVVSRLSCSCGFSGIERLWSDLFAGEDRQSRRWMARLVSRTTAASLSDVLVSTYRLLDLTVCGTTRAIRLSLCVEFSWRPCLSGRYDLFLHQPGVVVLWLVG